MVIHTPVLLSAALRVSAGVAAHAFDGFAYAIGTSSIKRRSKQVVLTCAESLSEETTRCVSADMAGLGVGFHSSCGSISRLQARVDR